MPRVETIVIRVNQTEKEKAEQLAASQGMTVSAYLRRCINMPKRPKRQAA